jgi:hypothetical protein
MIARALQYVAAECERCGHSVTPSEQVGDANGRLRLRYRCSCCRRCWVGNWAIAHADYVAREFRALVADGWLVRKGHLLVSPSERNEGLW